MKLSNNLKIAGMGATLVAGILGSVATALDLNEMVNKSKKHKTHKTHKTYTERIKGKEIEVEHK